MKNLRSNWAFAVLPICAMLWGMDATAQSASHQSEGSAKSQQTHPRDSLNIFDASNRVEVKAPTHVSTIGEPAEISLVTHAPGLIPFLCAIR
jgi:hypothetical protein